MFDVARAALLRAGIAEDKLPRMHHGLIEVFRRQVIQSGKIELRLADDLGWAESLRIKADYTGMETQPQIATEAVEKARLFVQVVQRAYALDEASLDSTYENDAPKPDDKVLDAAESQAMSPEEVRRQARENWLRLRQRAISGERGFGRERDNACEVNDGMEHSLDTDLDG